MSDHLFALMIRACREKRGLSQRALGDLCSPPRQQGTIAEWEGTRYALRETTLEAVAAALGLSLRALLAEGLRLTAPPRARKAPRPEEPPPEPPASPPDTI